MIRLILILPNNTKKYYSLSRVPMIGEYILIDDKEYKCYKVFHNTFRINEADNKNFNSFVAKVHLKEMKNDDKSLQAKTSC